MHSHRNLLIHVMHAHSTLVSFPRGSSVAMKTVRTRAAVSDCMLSTVRVPAVSVVLLSCYACIRPCKTNSQESSPCRSALRRVGLLGLSRGIVHFSQQSCGIGRFSCQSWGKNVAAGLKKSLPGWTNTCNLRTAQPWPQNLLASLTVPLSVNATCGLSHC